MSDETRTVAAGERVESAARGSIVSPPGYDLLGEVGRGAMGVVYRANDVDLARDVAVKILQPEYASDSLTARRFVDEARITGRLQHPGIPAVYRVGALPDGRPFLAMKLIAGRTLENLLTEPAGQEQEFIRRGRLLAVFEKIAEAVGYAHSEGIIHRDLKPSNVMVGQFGEVQAMDWGLARSVDRKPEVEAERTAAPAMTLDYRPGTAYATPHAEMTQAGSVLGTPAFMPPEQAIGAIDQIGKRSDVFGLGAILCVILTGKPPFVGEDAETTRQLAARAKLDDAHARLDSCGAEPELIALAKRCLSAEPENRPADGGEVATAVAAVRADAERRARQAETDRATADVRTAEERKRRVVRRAFAFTMLGLFAVIGFAAWWIDHEHSARHADQIARETEIRTRQLTTERDVLAALNEVQVLREEGWTQADDLPHWALTLTAARSSLRRAEGLLAAGEPTDDLRARVAAVATELDHDDRDRDLLVKLDRVSEENDVRFLFPFALTDTVARRYAAVFKENGVDLAVVSKDEAAAWLRAHRFRDRLVAAVRSWQLAIPTFDPSTGNAEARNHLIAILDAVTDDPFVREWWTAVSRKDTAAVKKLLARPELARMPSRDLASFADGLGVSEGTYTNNPFDAELAVLLHHAYDRFPGEYWVNFRLASNVLMGQAAPPEDPLRLGVLRHLNAAVAARPRSGIARSVLGMSLIRVNKGDPVGVRMLHAAVDIDPSSPWPALFLGMHCRESKDWPGAIAAFQKAARADPDTSLFMISSVLIFRGAPSASSISPDPEIAHLADALIAAAPDHPGGYDIRGSFRMATGDYRGALADFRKSVAIAKPEYVLQPRTKMLVALLEPMSRWEEKLPAVLRGELRPANATEYGELAGYCAFFEKRYVLAARFADEALKANPVLASFTNKMNEFAGWAVQAADGKGTDAANLTLEERTRLRRQALKWLRDAVARHTTADRAFLLATLKNNADLRPVFDAKEMAKLPPDELAEWQQFWTDIQPPPPPPKGPLIAPPPRERTAPPPREVKR